MTTITIPDWFLYLVTFWLSIQVLDIILKGILWYLNRRVQKQLKELLDRNE